MNKPDQGEMVLPRVGLRFAPRVISFPRADEERMLGYVGVDPEIYGGNIDLAAFIPHAIREAVRNGISANGMVNMMQKIVVDAPLKLGEKIEVTGEVVEVTQTPRGIVWVCDTNYAPANGGAGVRTRRTALMTDPSIKADPSQRGTVPRPAAAIEDPRPLRSLTTIQMTPQDCVGYCGDTSNLIHTDLPFAQNAGYRAPIVGGSHGVRYMTAALWQAKAPTTLDVDIMFRRPIFWDDAFDVRVDDTGGTWRALCTERGGKVMSEMRINAIA